MTPTQLLFMGLLFCCALARAVVMRNCAVSIKATEAPILVGTCIILISALIYPFFGDKLDAGLAVSLANPHLILISLTKGFILWTGISLQQILTKKSASSTAFKGPLALVVLALGNQFMGESLTTVQWWSILALAFISLGFFMKGHFKTLPTKYKLLFVVIVLTGSLPGMTDQAVLSQSNWYTHMFFSGIGMTLCALLTNLSASRIKALFSVPQNLFTGAVWAITEVFILASMITYIPVTMAALALTMSLPATMLISGLLWKEGHWAKQAAFGVAAYAAMIPMII